MVTLEAWPCPPLWDDNLIREPLCIILEVCYNIMSYYILRNEVIHCILYRHGNHVMTFTQFLRKITLPQSMKFGVLISEQDLEHGVDINGSWSCDHEIYLVTFQYWNLAEWTTYSDLTVGVLLRWKVENKSNTSTRGVWSCYLAPSIQRDSISVNIVCNHGNTNLIPTYHWI